MKQLALASSLAAIALAFGVASAAAQPFSFAGVTFDQAGAFTKAEALGDGVKLGNLTLSSGVPERLTSRVRFPAGEAAGFNAGRSVGTLARGRSDGPRALVIPRGADGHSVRHGLRLSFTERVGIVNLSGPDLVVYESGSRANGPDAFALRARNAVTGEWSSWYYEASSNFQFYTGHATAGAFSTQIDLAKLGFETGDLADAIEIVNLLASDRVKAEGERGTGVLLLDGEGAMPDPNAKAITDFIDRNKFDPDILYAAALRPLVALPAAVAAEPVK